MLDVRRHILSGSFVSCSVAQHRKNMQRHILSPEVWRNTAIPCQTCGGIGLLKCGAAQKKYAAAYFQRIFGLLKRGTGKVVLLTARTRKARE